MTIQELDELPEQAKIEFREKDLLSFWDEIFPEGHSFHHLQSRQIYTDSFQRIVQAWGEPSSNMNFLPGSGWKYSFTASMVKASLTTAFLAGALYFMGIANIPAILIPTILPLFFDVTRVKLTKGDDFLLAELHAAKNVVGVFYTQEEWYDFLSPELQKNLGRIDFYDFLEKLLDCGIAKEDDHGRIAVIRSTQKIKLNVE